MNELGYYACVSGLDGIMFGLLLSSSFPVSLHPLVIGILGGVVALLFLLEEKIVTFKKEEKESDRKRNRKS